MKKNIIIVGVFILVILLGVFIFTTRYQQVSFRFEVSDINAELYKDDKKISDVKSGASILLETGSYTIRSTNDKYSKEEVAINVTNSVKEFPVTFSYGADYLSSLLNEKELNSINSAIETKYGQMLSNFILDKGKLLQKGEWYVTTLYQFTSDESQIPDTYRVVLKKDKGAWIIATVPSLVLTSPLNNDIPKDVLQAANDL